MLYYTIRSKQSSCAFRSSVTALPSSWTSTCFPDSHLTNTCRPPWPWTRVAWAASRCLDLGDLYRTNPSADVSCPRLCVSWKTRNVIGKSNQTQTISLATDNERRCPLFLTSLSKRSKWKCSMAHDTSGPWKRWQGTDFNFKKYTCKTLMHKPWTNQKFKGYWPGTDDLLVLSRSF